MSSPSCQPTATLCFIEQHIINPGVPIAYGNLHPACSLGKTCVLGQVKSCPMAMLLSNYQDSGLWDASDPKHRACYFGQPCSVTGEKLCARILHLPKHSHVYGNCSAFSGPGHDNCPRITELDRRWLFPSCSACGVLTEARGLILIHRRMLDECTVDDKFTDTDIECIKNSLTGYTRAYEIRRAMHCQELREQEQAAFELEMRCARGENATQFASGMMIERNGWWKKTVAHVIKAVVRAFST